MKVIKIVIYSLVVALIAQTFIIGCPTCVKSPGDKTTSANNTARGNGVKSVTGEMGNGSNQSNQNNSLASVIAAQAAKGNVQP